MALSYRPVDRDQQFLLPVDMREWLPTDHPVWLVLDVVAAVDTRAFHAAARLGGAGRQPYDPDMLLALLVYASWVGESSSRTVERLCRTDVAFRLICAQDPPDHTTLARFRATHLDAVVELFEQVLRLCLRAGLGRFGVVALDGTKVAANASAQANRTESTLRAIAAELAERGRAVDAAEDALLGTARGDELPAALSCPDRRVEQVAAMLADIDAERAAADEAVRAPARQRAAARLATAEQRRDGERDALVAEQAARSERDRAAAAQGRTLPGTRPVPVEQHSRLVVAQGKVGRARDRLAAVEQRVAELAERKRNLTDPDSRLLSTRGGWVQGYNCQVVVADDQLIVAVAAGQATGDSGCYVPMVASAVAGLRRARRSCRRSDLRIGHVVADAGYLSEANLAATGPRRLIATGSRRGEPLPRDEQSRAAAMTELLGRPEYKALYKRRSATVEPVNAHLKDRRGLRRFACRGIRAANAELHLAALVTNLTKLHRSRGRVPG